MRLLNKKLINQWSHLLFGKKLKILCAFVLKERLMIKKNKNDSQ